MDPARRDRAIRQHLQTLELLGVDVLPRGANAPVLTESSASEPAVPPSRPSPSPPPPPRPTGRPAPTPAADTGDKPAALDALRAEMEADPRIQAVRPPGTNMVFGEGDVDAAIMFVGEGPGADEDRVGRPFVGKAGQLLDKMIEAMGLKREAVYIANVAKYRPPGNRTPTPEEAAVYLPFLARQIAVIQPGALVALGGASAKALLNTQTGITRLRGQWHDWPDVQPPIPLMPTFHPAYLLRSYTRDNRAKVWDDLKAVLDRVGLSLPGRGDRG